MVRLNPRGLLVAVAAIGLFVAVGRPAVRGYQALCAGPVDTYPAFESALNQARAEATAPPLLSGSTAAGPPAPVPGFNPAPLVASVRASALDLFLRVKQSDPVAFTTHVVAGAVLQVGGCPSEATADQWRKAAAHAWADLPARLAAFGLERTSVQARGLDATLDVLNRYAASDPWYGENLRRVAAQIRDAPAQR